MIAVYLLGILAVASGAPQFWSRPPRHHHRDMKFPDNYFSEEIFDATRFWNDLAQELEKLDDAVNEFSKHFTVNSIKARIEGNEYKIEISLPGFNEKEIAVKANDCVVMIQAVQKHAGGVERSYMDLRTLPASVDPAGSWTYDNGVLKIVFPVKNKVTSTTESAVIDETTAFAETEGGEWSSQEVEATQSNVNNRNADIGLEAIDMNKDNELKYNIIPKNDNTVEATTYAVDLKNEIEFVPVKY